MCSTNIEPGEGGEMFQRLLRVIAAQQEKLLVIEKVNTSTFVVFSSFSTSEICKSLDKL